MRDRNGSWTPSAASLSGGPPCPRSRRTRRIPGIRPLQGHQRRRVRHRWRHHPHPLTAPPHKEDESMSNARELIDRYFDLAPQADADDYFAQFTDDAIVEDEDQAYR